MQKQQTNFDKAAASAQLPAGEPLVDRNMNTNEAAEYIMSEFPQEQQGRQQPAESAEQHIGDSINDFDDFDRSLSASLEQKQTLEAVNSANKEKPSETQLSNIQLPKAQLPPANDTLHVYQQFLERMDQFFVFEQAQNQLENEQFQKLLAQKEFDQRKLYEFLDLRLSQVQRQEHEQAPSVRSSREVEAEPQEQERTPAKDMFKCPERRHEVVKQEDTAVHRNEGFKRAVVEQKSCSVQCEAEELILRRGKHKKGHGKDEQRKRTRKCAEQQTEAQHTQQPFCPAQFQPLQFMLPYMPFCGQMVCPPAPETQPAPQAVETVEKALERPEMVNEFTSYHEQTRRRPRASLEREKCINAEDVNINTNEERKVEGRAVETIAKSAEPTPAIEAVPFVEAAQKVERQTHSSFPRQENLAENDSPESRTSLGEIYPKYDGKQADFMCRNGMGIGAYENSVFSDWNLSELYSSQLSEGEMRRNFAHVQNYDGGK